MAQYNGQAVIPIDKVVQDFFPHLSTDKFLRKASTGEIAIPIVRVDPTSQKGAKGIHLGDLASFLDTRRLAAQKEVNQLTGKGPT